MANACANFMTFCGGVLKTRSGMVPFIAAGFTLCHVSAQFCARRRGRGQSGCMEVGLGQGVGAGAYKVEVEPAVLAHQHLGDQVDAHLCVVAAPVALEAPDRARRARSQRDRHSTVRAGLRCQGRRACARGQARTWWP